MTEKYNVSFKKSAARELAAIPTRDLRRIIQRVRQLEQNPRPVGSQKLAVQEAYRVRQGDYRVVYTIDDAQRAVSVVKVGHRREVYRS